MSLAHHLSSMVGRDPNERHRASTPLELLFDLTFAVAFSAASTQAALVLESGQFVPALAGFGFAVLAASWAWVNYSWLASAYDNDDIFFRVATFVEMIGVLIVALGIPQVFRSIEAGAHVDNAVMVAGYVVMRVAAVALWLRAARHDPKRRRVCLTYAVSISVAQVGWIGLILLSLPLIQTLIVTVLLAGVELLGPVLAERKDGGTPWNPFHIAERYSLLVIITLGEVLLGTVLAISAVVDRLGWSVEAIEVAVSGTGLAFGLWWLYFTTSSGRVLARYRERAFGWSYGHIILFGSVTAVGTGLHLAASFVSRESHLDAVETVLTVAIPVFVFELTLATIYSILLRRLDRLHMWLFAGAAVVLAAAVGAVAVGASMGSALLITACSPLVVVVGYETAGYRHEREALDKAGV